MQLNTSDNDLGEAFEKSSWVVLPCNSTSSSIPPSTATSASSPRLPSPHHQEPTPPNPTTKSKPSQAPQVPEKDPAQRFKNNHWYSLWILYTILIVWNILLYILRISNLDIASECNHGYFAYVVQTSHLTAITSLMWIGGVGWFHAFADNPVEDVDPASFWLTVVGWVECLVTPFVMAAI